MEKRPDIVMLALPRWDGAYSSTAFSLAKEFSKTTRVFYIDNPFTIKDFIVNFWSRQIRIRRLALLFGINTFKPLTEYSENLIAVTPRIIVPSNFLSEGKLYDAISRLNDRIVSRAVRKMVKQYEIDRFIFINSFNPFFFRTFPVYFRPALYIYHTVDDISHSKYIKRHGPRLENQAITQAHLTLTTSRELRRLKESLSKRIYYLPNAADVRLFSTCRNTQLEIPDEIRGINKKIIVYTGHLDFRLNYELLKRIARTHADKVLLLVGPASLDKKLMEDLSQLPNIIFTGPKDLSELPRYLQHSHCAIIPFLCNTLTKSIYPLKVNEYLAAGKPVVSTPFSEDILDFKEVIDITEDPDQFCKYIEESLANDSLERVRARVDAAEHNTWEYRAGTFWQIVNECLPDA